ncbi:hypothetical protein OIV83_001710 [Microbotryomycetes sp. JL201]|nr:hypothetical protein OIV83_001710 [Microbotryomycetes sp. JL201]
MSGQQPRVVLAESPMAIGSEETGPGASYFASSPGAAENGRATTSEHAGDMSKINMDRHASSILQERTEEYLQGGPAPYPTRSASVPGPQPNGVRRRQWASSDAQRGTNGTRRPSNPARKPTLLNKTLLEPSKPLASPPSLRQSFMHIIKYSWLNVLLVFIPVSWACHFTNQAPALTFTFSALAIIPLAGLLGLGTEEIALRTSETIGGLINATLGNTVEFLTALLALVKGELRVVQSSLLGGIISNTCLVLGMSLFASGLRFHEAGYSTRPAQLQINLLGISTTAIVIPIAFHVFIDARQVEPLDLTDRNVQKISHGVAIILLFVYAGFLLFQLWTHAYLYMPEEKDGDENGSPPSPRPVDMDGPQPPIGTRVFRLPSFPSWGSSSSASSESSIESHNPKLSFKVSLALLVTVTAITGVTAEWLVSAIEPMTASGNISKEFVALILLPLIGNARLSLPQKANLANLAMSVAVGSSIQIALFVIPLLILIAWAIGQPLTLYFDPFEGVVFFLATFSVIIAIQDKYSNWLEGATLMTLYLIIAVVFWYYPGIDA